MFQQSSMEKRIPVCMREVIGNYDRLRGKDICKEDNFWDVVAISSADEEQAKAFELQINYKIAKKELPLNVPFHVISDPNGQKIGNGGSTLHVLQTLHEMMGKKFFSKRILLIHAGGSSKRLPSASVLGKIFSPLPLGNPMYQMLDLKLALYLPFAKHMKPGVCVVCSDDIETYFVNSFEGISKKWPSELPSFLALGHRGDICIGENHGVYILQEIRNVLGEDVTFHYCQQVLQKPTKQTMLEKGAIIEDFGVCTDSIFYFSHNVTQKFLEYYTETKPLTFEIDAYRDFLQALGKAADKNYINAKENKDERTIKEELYNLLNPFPLGIILLHASRFYHLGTCMEYVENLTQGYSSLFEELGMCPLTSSKISNGNQKLNNSEEFTITYPNVTVMQTIIAAPLSISGPSVIEYCEFTSAISIGERCILSNCFCSSNDHVTIPPGTLMSTIPIVLGEYPVYVTIAFGVENDLKKSFSSSDLESLMYFDKSINDLVKIRCCNDIHSLFDCGTDSYSLWSMKLFEPAQTLNESFLLTLNLVQSFRDGEKLLEDEAKEFSRMSMCDIIEHKDTQATLAFRENLQKKISAFV